MVNILQYVSCKNYNAIYFMGDWNNNLHNQSDLQVRDFINLMFNHFLLPTTTKPTRISNNSASLIDHIWTSKTESIIGNYIVYTDISAHFPVVFQYRENSVRTQQERWVYNRVLSKGNVARFADCVAQVSWDDVLQSNCPSDAYNKFHDKFIEIFRNYFPLICMKQNKFSSTTRYLTPGLIRSIKEKRRFARLAKKRPISYRDI